MNTKDLIKNQEIVNNLAESLDDIPQDPNAKYALWIVGLDDKEPKTELFIYEFDTPEEAVAKAEDVNFRFIEEQIEKPVLYYCDINDITHFSVEVETVVPDFDDEDGGTMNIGTIYKRDLWLDGEYGEYDTGEEIGLDEEPIIALLTSDYEILNDNTFKIRKELLKDFNKNDEVNIYFADNKDSDILRLKIMSKVIYADGDYYHCELVL